MDGLGDHAAELYTVLTGGSEATGDTEVRVDPDRLERRERDLLLATACAVLDRDSTDDNAQLAARLLLRGISRPVFTAAACAHLFARLADHTVTGGVRVAAGAMLRCPDFAVTDELRASAAALVERALVNGGWHAQDATLAVAGVAGPDSERMVVDRIRADIADSPLRLAELEVLRAANPVQRALVADEPERYEMGRVWERLPDAPHRLAAVPGYEAWARETLTAACARLTAIHARRLPYLADQAFSATDCDTLRRAARLGLELDQPWAGELLAELLPRVAVAPTVARTMPSQAACIQLALTVEAHPTPESVAAVHETYRVVRHSGVKKKLDRLVRRAERALANRPETAIRLPDLGVAPDGTARVQAGVHYAALTVEEDIDLTWRNAQDEPYVGVPAQVRRDFPAALTAANALRTKLRAQLRVLSRVLEDTYTFPTGYRYDRWRDNLATHPVGHSISDRLIWEYATGPDTWTSFLPTDGLPEPDPGTEVRLWHPVRATAEGRAYWRDRVLDGKIRQPFRQAFREQYAPPETGRGTAMFTGYVLRLEQALGLAVREGWTTEYDSLTRTFGDVRVTLPLGARLRPGATGWATAGDLALDRQLQDLHPLPVSEILRAVDLLISVSGYARNDTTLDFARWPELRRLSALPLTDMSRLRHDTLTRVLSPHIEAGRVTLSDHHVHVGNHAVHVATGRVTRDGEQVDVPVLQTRGTTPMPYLPYEERLLEHVLRMVELLLVGARQVEA
ncbi:DUF4132 domain-containing protein [Streptomyces smaragdinus]|nr:DUF4132 domain-containing protein [Streptomyces smaragdinus]